MKIFKKMMAIAVSFLMMLAMATTVFAANNLTITVDHTTKDQTYTLYKLFDATVNANRAGQTDSNSSTEVETDGINYTLPSDKSLEKEYTYTDSAGNTHTVKGSTWFKLDSGGDVVIKDSTAQAAITDDNADFAAWAKAFGVKISTITPDTDGGEVKWTGLAEGYYFITTTTGSLVTVTSIAPNAIVMDKNTVPTVDKKITGASNVTEGGKQALAQIGTDVTYTATVTIGKGSKNVKFHDKMTEGLSLKKDTIEVNGNGITSNEYTVLETADEGDTFTIKFADGIADGTVITITYKATITQDAVTKKENDATVTYGDNNTSTTESKTEVYNAKIAVLKFDGEKANGKYLSGAGFKLKNSDGKYYKLSGTEVSWEKEETDGDEHTSDKDGNVQAFIGLPAGKYTLVETTTPAGYNTADDTEIEVKADDYTPANLAQTAEIENKTGTVLPSTGGIGTTIFYAVGALLIAGSVVLFTRKRRQHI